MTGKLIVMHPNSWSDIVQNQAYKPDGNSLDLTLFGMRVVLDKFAPQKIETGRFVVGGKSTALNSIRITSRFVEYGPEDLEWLLYSGTITREYNYNAYLVDVPKMDGYIGDVLRPSLSRQS